MRYMHGMTLPSSVFFDATFPNKPSSSCFLGFLLYPMTLHLVTSAAGFGERSSFSFPTPGSTLSLRESNRGKPAPILLNIHRILSTIRVHRTRGTAEEGVRQDGLWPYLEGNEENESQERG